MAHLWMQDDSTDEWVVLPLDREVYRLAVDNGHPLLAGDSSELQQGAVVAAERCGRGAMWLVLSGDHNQVQLNGAPLATDSARSKTRRAGGCGRCRFFFSTNASRKSSRSGFGRGSLLSALQGPDRCRHTRGSLPQCGVWHHMLQDCPCWSYAPHCTLCDQRTDLDSGYRWTPEEV